MGTWYRAYFVGGIWWPYGAVCSTSEEFLADSDEDALERIDFMGGDFSSILGSQVVNLTTGATVKEWDSEDAEMAYYDTLGEDE